MGSNHIKSFGNRFTANYSHSHRFIAKNTIDLMTALFAERSEFVLL